MIRLILLSDFTEAYASNLLKGIQEYARGREPWVVCRMPTSFRIEHGLEGVVNWACHWKADAIIGQFDSSDDVGMFPRHGIIALAQDFKRRFDTIPNLTGDYLSQGRKVADYFVSKGFRNFAFYGYEDAVWSEERGRGFRIRLQELGMGEEVSDYQKQPLENLWYYDSDPLVEWIRALPHPTAIFACDDTRANTILEVCRMLNIRVPVDIAVLGVDNDEITCSLSYPSLSSLDLDVFHAGYEAATYINELLRGIETEIRDVIVGFNEIVERQSTDIFATKNKYILKVLSYIHLHLSEDLSVASLLQMVPMSRRLFEEIFKRETGQPIHQYVISLRVRRLAQLLVCSSDSIEDLSLEVGLGSPKNLSRMFKNRIGVSPQEYRQKHKNNP